MRAGRLFFQEIRVGWGTSVYWDKRSNISVLSQYNGFAINHCKRLSALSLMKRFQEFSPFSIREVACAIAIRGSCMTNVLRTCLICSSDSAISRSSIPSDILWSIDWACAASSWLLLSSYPRGGSYGKTFIIFVRFHTIMESMLNLKQVPISLDISNVIHSSLNPYLSNSRARDLAGLHRSCGLSMHDQDRMCDCREVLVDHRYDDLEVITPHQLFTFLRVLCGSSWE